MEPIECLGTILSERTFQRDVDMADQNSLQRNAFIGLMTGFPVAE
jgi:hypothetical protein